MTKGRNTTYEERVEIVSYCIEHGNDYVATIEKYGVSYQQIYSWVRKYKEKGAEGLVDKRGKRKLESEMTELEKLRAENRMLEARNKRLELECAVLKKLEEIEGRWRCAVCDKSISIFAFRKCTKRDMLLPRFATSWI